MKDALGHGSNPRGGVAAHQAGVDVMAQHVNSLTELAKDNAGFDAKVAALAADKSLTREHMRQIATGFLGYGVKASTGRSGAIAEIKSKQAFNQRQASRADQIGKWAGKSW